MIVLRYLPLVCVLAICGPAGCHCVSRAGPGATETTSGTTTASGASVGQTVTSGGGSTGAPPDVPAGCQPELYGECDPYCQDCPEGQKCLPFATDGTSWDATRCGPIAPDPKTPGEPCTAPQGPIASVDDCEKGAMCWEVSLDTYEGTCVPLCSGSLDDAQCSNFEVCEIYNEGVLPLCVAWCNPLDPSPCIDASDLCLMGDGVGDPIAPPYDPVAVFFHCVLRPETDPQGFPCIHANSCDFGLACADATLVPGCDPQAAPGCCARWCDLSQPECPEGGTCQPVLLPHPDLPQEFADLGLCLLP